MRKIIFFALAMACISTVSYAQEVKEIKPFTPNAQDAAKIKSILARMSKSAYSIEVRPTLTYGVLKGENIRAGSAGNVIGKAADGGWVESVLTKVITSTRTIDKAALVELQAIAARYQ